ncbi:hypothetical protein B7494_g8119 [Chlorociboria aeruginascens]|nr:hypothetical protein B7494_g8119 [Chlorociboria aeruginascens]
MKAPIFNNPARQPLSTDHTTEGQPSAAKGKEFQMSPAILCRGSPLPPLLSFPMISTMVPEDKVTSVVHTAMPVDRVHAHDRIRTRGQTSGADYERAKRMLGKGKGKSATQPEPETGDEEKEQNRHEIDHDQAASRVIDLGEVSDHEMTESNNQRHVRYRDARSQTAENDPYRPTPQTKTNKSKVTKDSIPIKLVDETALTRFDIAGFLCNTDITLKFGQLLDRSPQIRAQLARHLQAKVPSRKKRRGVYAMVVTRGPAPTVLDEALNDDTEADIKCYYIEAYVDNFKLKHCMVDGGAAADLIAPTIVEQLQLKTYTLDRGWYVKLADSRRVPITQYVLIQVVVAGIRTYLRAFVLSLQDVCDLLLSRNWMARVGAIEDHLHNTLTIRGKTGMEVQVPASGAPPTVAQSIPEVQVPDKEENSVSDEESYYSDDDEDVEDEVNNLLGQVELLDQLEYQMGPQGKVSRQ